jgi:hypothetical protein
MLSEKELRAAAKELQSVLIMDPPIDSKAKIPVLTEQMKEAIEEIKPGDEFSEETQAVIDELSGKAGADDDDEEEEAPVAKKKVAKKVAPVEEVDDEPEDDEEEASLEDQIDACQKVAELTPIVKANAVFKSLLKKLPTFTKGSVLKAEMLSLLAQEVARKKMVEKIDAAPIKKPKVEEADDDDEEEEEKPTKKAGSGKTPFKSTRETLGTTRMAEVAKAMQSIKGSQTIDAVAAVADGKFVKAGGVSNIKQSKNIIKVLLPAATEWGIIIEKGGKLSNA